MVAKADPPELVKGNDGKMRCGWNIDDPDYRRYHDEEFGRPVDSDRRIFEKICIEGFASGLSYIMVLKKREALRAAFDNFDIDTVAQYEENKIDALMANKAIINNRKKIASVINNAKRAKELIAEVGSLAAFVWSFEPPEQDRPDHIDMATLKEITETAQSRALAKGLKQRGWSYIGPTTAYAMMQSLGIVNDHLTGCDIRKACLAERKQFSPPQRQDQSVG